MTGNERLGMERIVNERLGDESKKTAPTKGWPMRTADERITDEYGDEIDLMDRDPKNLNTNVVKVGRPRVLYPPTPSPKTPVFKKVLDLVCQRVGKNQSQAA